MWWADFYTGERGLPMTYTSNAKWTKIEDSQDTHATREGAQAVCTRMLTDYSKHSPCEIRGVCLEAWVEEGPEFDIDKMNDCLLLGMVDSRVSRYNAKGWGIISKMSTGHNIGTRTTEMAMVIDDMHRNAMSDEPKE